MRFSSCPSRAMLSNFGAGSEPDGGGGECRSHSGQWGEKNPGSGHEGAILLVAVQPKHGSPKSNNAWRAEGALWRRPIPPIDKRSAKSFIRTNERIRAREVRVIDENGEQLGVMAPFDALKMARERSLDLVEISPNAVPPVCKIQDYGKYLY